MKKLKIEDVVLAVGGTFYGEKKLLKSFISKVSTDSRIMSENSLFVPIKGEKFDAHDFIPQAFENGAVCSLSEKTLDGNFILVSSTSKALLDLAEYYRNMFDVKVVAVTGSCGKTTTKDLITSVLATKFNVVKTKGNFNNHIGLPLTIFGIDDDTEVVVLEMGTNHFGEISALSKVSRPDVCVITNIGFAHMENFLSREGILKAKMEIFDYAKDNFCAILNGDDEYLQKVDLKNMFRCGLDVSNDIFAYDVDIENKSFAVNVLSGVKINLSYLGEFMIQNSLLAVAVGKYFGVGDDEIKFGLENVSFSDMRMNFIETKKDFVIINDAYNASPSSMKAAIEVLLNTDIRKRKICILGDMFELGTQAEELHFEIGNYLSDKRIDLVICIGQLAKKIFDGISPQSNFQKLYYATKTELFNNLSSISFQDSVVLVKASRGMHFEEIVEQLKR